MIIYTSTPCSIFFFTSVTYHFISIIEYNVSIVICYFSFLHLFSLIFFFLLQFVYTIENVKIIDYARNVLINDVLIHLSQLPASFFQIFSFK